VFGPWRRLGRQDRLCAQTAPTAAAVVCPRQGHYARARSWHRHRPAPVAGDRAVSSGRRRAWGRSRRRQPEAIPPLLDGPGRSQHQDPALHPRQAPVQDRGIIAVTARWPSASVPPRTTSTAMPSRRYRVPIVAGSTSKSSTASIFMISSRSFLGRRRFSGEATWLQPDDARSRVSARCQLPALC